MQRQRGLLECPNGLRTCTGAFETPTGLEQRKSNARRQLRLTAAIFSFFRFNRFAHFAWSTFTLTRLVLFGVTGWFGESGWLFIVFVLLENNHRGSRVHIFVSS